MNGSRFPHVPRLFVFALCMTVGSVAAAGEPRTPSPDEAAVRSLVDKIDERIEARWKKEGVKPAEPVGDAEFMRRAYLDICGKIPPVSELREFLDDKSPGKRGKLVNRLLESPAYITHFSNIWRSIMLPETQADFQARFLIPGFETWLQKKFREDTKYDEIVREIVTLPLNGRGARNRFPQPGDVSPIAFYQAKQVKPENLAAATSRMFLGIRIECAQCHHHPFDDWKQEQFWSYAAFFSGIERTAGQGIFGSFTELFDKAELKIPDTDTVVKAAYFDGTTPDWQRGQSSRKTLAEWMTSAENPYFARTAVNRMWGQFFGAGIVDPVDDFGPSNEASHPELLGELAREFSAHQFDMKFLIRAITASRPYQLSSRQTDTAQANPQLFAKMAVKGLTAEQLFNSLSQATGYYEPPQNRNPFAIGNNTPRSEFLEAFSDTSNSPLERQTTILQALAMMNGRFVADATGLENSSTLAAIAEFPEFQSSADRIEALYYAVLSRPPSEAETKKLVKYIDGGGTKKDPKLALSDVFWALLNSSEFMFNH